VLGGSKPNIRLETKIMSFMRYRIRVSLLSLAAALGAAPLHAAGNPSQVTIHELRGESLTHSLIGTNPVRKLAVYLPPTSSMSTASRMRPKNTTVFGMRTNGARMAAS
jgi:hypothetical protein